MKARRTAPNATAAEPRMTDQPHRRDDPTPDAAAPGEAARNWVTRLASGDMDDAEMARFKAWLAADPGHRRAFDEARALWQRAGAVEDVFTISHRPWHRRAAIRAGLAVGALAASLALVVGFDDMTSSLRADYATAAGAQRSVTLADGSTVHLNTDSAIALRFTEGERRVELLRGEALFDVARDSERPFRVLAQGGVTQAIGTAFVVRDEGERVVVSVTAGHVAVTSPEADAAPTTATLAAKAGERVAYRHSEAPQFVGAVAPADAAPWRDGRLVMEGVPLANAIAELDRYKPGRILLLGDPSRYRPVSGVFALDQLGQALDGLAATHNLQVIHLTEYLLILR